MSETYVFSLDLHLAFCKAILAMFAIHLVLVFMGNTAKFSYIKRLMLFLPSYYLFMALIFFTGILNLAISEFSLSLSILVMILAWFALLFLGILGFKRLKRVRKDRNFFEFKRFMALKIIAEAVILGLTILVGVKF